MIYLLTGQPGNGKTLMGMDLMRIEHDRNEAAVKEGKEELRRFFSNVAGATTEENPDAFPWVERLPEHNDWTKLPDGSYVQYDEAHADGKTPGLERYGVLFPGTGKPGESADPRIRSMATHRHRGFDLVLMTQWPSKVHHNVRQLVGKHVHMNRAMGLQRAGVLTWTRAQPDPYDEKEREKAEEEIWAYPKDLYNRYKSSTVHTASYKFKVPKKVWSALSMLVMMVIVGWALWTFVFKPDDLPKKEDVVAPQRQAATAAPAAARSSDVVGSVEEYVAMHRPRIEEIPGSAPIYDKRPVLSVPKLACWISKREDRRGECRCMTEQSTRYHMGQKACRRLVFEGMPYDPYKAPPEEVRGVGVATPTVEGAAAPAVAAAVGTGALYGASPPPASTFALDPAANPL